MKKEKIIKLNILSKLDREDIISILAHNGYKVWVEVKESETEPTKNFVVFEFKN